MNNLDPNTAIVVILLFALVMVSVLRKIPFMRTLITAGVVLGVTIGVIGTVLAVGVP